MTLSFQILCMEEIKHYIELKEEKSKKKWGRKWYARVELPYMCEKLEHFKFFSVEEGGGVGLVGDMVFDVKHGPLNISLGIHYSASPHLTVEVSEQQSPHCCSLGSTSMYSSSSSAWSASAICPTCGSPTACLPLHKR